MKNPRSAAALAVAAALLLAGCGDDEESPEPTAEPMASISMTATEFAFDPSEPRAEQTGVVEFELSNEGEVAHNLEVETPEGEFELEENVPPGGTATLEAEVQEPGEYVIYCPVADHRERGMEGTLTVGGGDEPEQGGEPQQDPGGGSGGGVY